MADSTSITSLPQNKVTLTTTDKPINVKVGLNSSRSPSGSTHIPVGAKVSSSPSAELSSKTINQIVSGIQHASQAGLTRLPSRDIPMDTHRLVQDPQVKPNYVPKAENKDYIAQHDSYASLLKAKKSAVVSQNRLDNIYDELQLPLMVTVLYFFLQMPYFTKLLSRRLPSLFLKDRSPTFGGYITKSLIFGSLFFGINKLTRYLSES